MLNCKILSILANQEEQVCQWEHLDEKIQDATKKTEKQSKYILRLTSSPKVKPGPM